MSSPAEAFEARRFRTAAAHYLAGRVPYAPGLIRRVAERSQLQPEDRVMDLGCGPGVLTTAFAPFAGEVIGVDPEPEMLAAAQAGGVPENVRFIQGSSAELGPQFGRFQLVTMGRSFHWMDRADTLRRLDQIVAPEGAVALFHSHHLDVPENAPGRAYEAIVRAYSNDDPGRAARRSPEWPRHEAILLGSAFSRLERIGVVERRVAGIDQLIERALSLSTTSRARIGLRADDMVAELRAALAQVAPEGHVTEIVESIALIAWRL